MKIPLLLTGLIVAAGVFWSVQENRTLTTLRLRHQQVVSEAAALGISTDSSRPFALTKASKRQREDSTQKVKDFANTLVAFAKEMKEMEKAGKQPDQAMQKRIMEIVDGMLSFNGDELKIIIAEMRGRSDLDDETRKNMISFSIMMLAQQHPETALALFTESSDLMDENPMSKHVLSSALSQWAKDQPLAALEWIKKNAEKHPDLVTEEAKRAVITGAAQKDYNLAFQLANELKLDAKKGSIISAIAQAANTPEKQADFLKAVRQQAAKLSDKDAAQELIKNGLATIFSSVAHSGFDKSVEWMKTENLSADDTAGMVRNLSYYQTKDDTGKWLDWFATQKGEPDQLESSTRNLVRNWTTNDYRAAGEWLAKSPAGPMKEVAVISYLQTVAPYDPDVATQWAETLPVEKRSEQIKIIHAALEQKDKAAAEDYAKRHGLTAE